MVTYEQPIPTPEELREWFEKQPYQNVGISCDMYQNPISNYVSRQIHVPVQIFNLALGFKVGEIGSWLPNWTARFLRLVDKRFSRQHYINGDQALLFLDLALIVKPEPNPCDYRPRWCDDDHDMYADTLDLCCTNVIDIGRDEHAVVLAHVPRRRALEFIHQAFDAKYQKGGS
jgi:hypothetical protein